MYSAPMSGLVYYYDFSNFGGNRQVVFTSALQTNKQTNLHIEIHSKQAMSRIQFNYIK